MTDKSYKAAQKSKPLQQIPDFAECEASGNFHSSMYILLKVSQVSWAFIQTQTLCVHIKIPHVENGPFVLIKRQWVCG